VQAMDGRIWLESHEGRGTSFHFTVRAEAARADEEAPVPAADAPPLRPLHILLAEDNRVNQRLAVALLRRDGHTVTLVDNGEAAVAAAVAGAFDAILMDVQMPTMSGLDATAAIRERERATGMHVPIVAMTAHALHGDRERCLAAGMDGYVAKPVQLSALRRALRDAVPAEAQPVAAAG